MSFGVHISSQHTVSLVCFWTFLLTQLSTITLMLTQMPLRGNLATVIAYHLGASDIDSTVCAL